MDPLYDNFRLPFGNDDDEAGGPVVATFFRRMRCMAECWM
jgi:hypothetical protein